MLKACKYCNRIHDSKDKCKPMIEAEARRKEYLRSKKCRKTHTSDKFRNTQLWHDARQKALDRDYNMCRICFEYGVFNCNDISVHHIVPLRQDYAKRADTNNLITLCEGHHQIAEAGVYDVSYLTELAKESPKLSE